MINDENEGENENENQNKYKDKDFKSFCKTLEDPLDQQKINSFVNLLSDVLSSDYSIVLQQYTESFDYSLRRY